MGRQDRQARKKDDAVAYSNTRTSEAIIKVAVPVRVCQLHRFGLIGRRKIPTIVSARLLILFDSPVRQRTSVSIFPPTPDSFIHTAVLHATPCSVPTRISSGCGREGLVLVTNPPGHLDTLYQVPVARCASSPNHRCRPVSKRPLGLSHLGTL